MSASLSGNLTNQVAAVAPIFGVSIGTWNDKATWTVSFHLDATDEQKAAAALVITNFDVAAEQVKVDTAINLANSDTGMCRGLEDLIDTLITKGTIVLNDLPVALRTRIANRDTWRSEL